MRGKVNLLKLFIIIGLAVGVGSVSALKIDANYLPAVNGRVISNVITAGIVVTEAEEPDPGDKSNVYVDKSYNEDTAGWGVTRFNDIRAAAEAVDPGGTIHIMPGEYTLPKKIRDWFVVNKDITIAGEGEGEIIINLNNNIKDAGAIQVKDGARLEMSNLTIDGYGYSITYAVYVLKGHLTISNVTIKNINENANDNDDKNISCGIKVTRAIPSEVCNLTVDSCKFENIGRHAIRVENQEALIENCSFTGGSTKKAAVDQAGVCIFGENGRAEIRGSTFSNYTGPKAAGICVIKNAQVIQEDNIFNNCTKDIIISESEVY